MKASSSGCLKSGHVCDRLCQSSAILVHSWDISCSMLARFAQCWGSLEPSRGGMLEVIGAVGSRSGLCRRLCCYVTCFAQCWGSLEASRGGMLEVSGAAGSRSGLC